jgi:Serine/threonine protein phosphatase
MNISLHKPFSISETGKRVRNEDCIYPHAENGSADDRLFLVCDGVGESNKGKIASVLACNSIQTFFQTFLDSKKKFEADFIEKAVRYTEIRFDEYVQENKSAKGMATTLCLFYIASEGIYVTHAGDSRIYQFRNGRILFKTENHPLKNGIHRVIQGTEKPIEVDVIHLTDILPDDIFLLCTDGVLEAFREEDLSNLFSESSNVEKILSEIKETCRIKSKDNYSAHLISIQEVEKVNTFRQVMTSFLYACV